MNDQPGQRVYDDRLANHFKGEQQELERARADCARVLIKHKNHQSPEHRAAAMQAIKIDDAVIDLKTAWRKMDCTYRAPHFKRLDTDAFFDEALKTPLLTPPPQSTRPEQQGGIDFHDLIP